MAKNRKVFEEALSEAANFAWEQRWEPAIDAYQRALAEFPDDASALAGMGMALSELKRWNEALQAYQKAIQKDEETPGHPERIAYVLEQLGRPQEAAEAYLEAAERYTRRQAPNLAVERWRDAIRVYRRCVPAHVHLLQTYMANNQKSEALKQYLALAEVYHAENKIDKALELLQYALRLDSRNPDILAMMDRLRYGESPAPSDVDMIPFSDSSLDEEEEEPRGSPVEITRQKALTDLAETVFDETPPQTGPLVMRKLSKPEVDALITKALDAQTRGDVEEAIANYEHVLQAGVIQPAVNFNLGLLYQEQLRFEDGIAQFKQSIDDPEYRLGSHFALGECYRARGRIDEALTHFIEVLKIVDMATVQREQVDDLIQLYAELARTYAVKGERDQALDFLNSLIGFLGAKGWEDKVTQTRERLNALSHEGHILSLAEMLASPDGERIVESLGLAQEYLRRGLEDAAMDELNHALLLAPTYLTTHRQMGELLLQMGKLEQAVAKFLTIGDVYRVRGNLSQAVAMYERALSQAPTNVVVRAKLIELLISHGEIDRALEQYVTLGDTYYQMAQFDRAREKFNEALQLAPRGDPERRWAVRMLHRIGDIDLQRIDWRRAMSVYEEIRELAPDDEKARLTLMDLYSRFGQPKRALKELDGLLKALRQSGKSQKIIPVLEEIVQDRPDDIPIRVRLAQACLNARDVERAVVHLDKLGDLQLETGRKEEAVKTIRTIVRLNPPNVEEYEELLEHLA